MTYIISTTDGSKAHPLVRIRADGGAVLLAEIEVLYAQHSVGIACDLALLARKRNPSARIMVDGQDADLLCQMPARARAHS
ncbi:MAG: hypothetical protein K2X62_00725 [Beijerinckiaceae bacterium]|jgi:hypothetical protein|nr:hypothetical protein [Beijerinckiaceae bacterium]MDO9442157.1 hypothetical protein [Beijerinckiaceae bacterium]